MGERFELLQGESLPKSLKGLEVYLDTPEQQPGSLAFSLRLHNAGSSEMALRNPYAGLTCTVSNGEGWPVGQRSPGARVPADHPARASYLPLEAVSLDAAPLAREELLAAAEVSLPAGSELRYDLRIVTLVPPQGAEGPVTVVPDTYGLRCLFSARSTASSQPRSARLESPRVPVVVP